MAAHPKRPVQSPLRDALYVELHSQARSQPVTLALTVPADAPALDVSGLEVAWSPEMLALLGTALAEIEKASDGEIRTLPYASLRALFELALPEVARLEWHAGIRRGLLRQAGDGAGETRPFLWVEGEDQDHVSVMLHQMLREWISVYLDTGSRSQRISAATIGRIQRLADNGHALRVQSYRTTIIPWHGNELNGTACPQDRRGFPSLIDHLARHLAGRVLLPGCGPVRRIVVPYPNSGAVELITDPLSIDGTGEFSFVINLEIVTFPGVPQPLLTVDVSKRRWIRRLDEEAFDRSRISGFVFSDDHPRVAFGFSAVRESIEGKWQRVLDAAYHVLARHFTLDLAAEGASEVAARRADVASARALLVYRGRVSEDTHEMKSGVPEIDKLDAFEAVCDAVSDLGLRPFRGLRVVKTDHVTSAGAGRLVEASALLEAILADSGEASAVAPATFEVSKEEIENDLSRRFSLTIESIRHGTKIVADLFGSDTNAGQKRRTLADVREANCTAVKEIHGSERPLLIVFYHEESARDLRLLHAVTETLWGGCVEIQTAPLPPGTHGPRTALPGAAVSNREQRSRYRVETWRSTAEEIRGLDRRTACLIMAPLWYGRQKDDEINKAATRKALAALGSANVQFLLPPVHGKDGRIDLADFVLRTQAALRDLLLAHAGRMTGVKDAVQRAFGVGDHAPKEIIGITIVRQNSGRERGFLDPTFLPIAVRLHADGSGRCDLRFARERGGKVCVSRWRPFSDGLGEIAQVTPVTLGPSAQNEVRFTEFIERVVSESVESGANPLVIVDSSNCVRLWPWLSDQHITADDIRLMERRHMEVNWRGARIVRVRQDLAPGIIQDKFRVFALSGTEDQRIKDAMSADVELRLPTSTQELYRLVPDASTRGCVAYLSLATKDLHQNARGLSCYRPRLRPSSPGDHDGTRWVPGTNRSSAGVPLVVLKERDPHLGQWPTPNPLDLVVALRQEGDDPDRIAECVEQLRHGFGHYGGWTSLPAPLFFERVVRDYISGFQLEGNSPNGEGVQAVDAVDSA